MRSAILILIGIIAGAITSYFLFSNKNDSAQIPKKAEILLTNDMEGVGNIISTPRAKKFMEKFRKNPLNDTSKNKYITYSVHFDKAVFQFIGRYLDTTTREISGIRLIQIQYDKILDGDDGTVRGQRDSVQYSVFFVPTKPDRSSDWDAWKKEHFKFLGALNHGELCPNNCDGETR